MTRRRLLTVIAGWSAAVVLVWLVRMRPTGSRPLSRTEPIPASPSTTAVAGGVPDPSRTTTVMAQPTPTSSKDRARDPLWDALLTAAEVGPDFRSEDPPPDAALESGRIYRGAGGRVFLSISITAHPSTSAQEAAADEVNAPPDPGAFQEHLAESMQWGPPFTPTGFGDDAVAYRQTGVWAGGLPFVGWLVIWNDHGLQVRLGGFAIQLPATEGQPAFDGIVTAERQRDKLRATLPP